MLTAILIDIGGPIFAEDHEYAAWNEFLEERLAAAKLASGRFPPALAKAIERCDPAPWISALWEVARPHIETFKRLQAELRAFQADYLAERYRPRLREGVREVLTALSNDYRLALAGNQPARIKDFLQREGLLGLFSWRYVSEEMGVSKPNPLFFRMILDGLAVPPEKAVMVGDRLDQDILPARLMGLKTVMVSVGPYQEQRPLSPLHRPDIEIGSLAELPQALRRLEDHFSP